MNDVMLKVAGKNMLKSMVKNEIIRVINLDAVHQGNRGIMCEVNSTDPHIFGKLFVSGEFAKTILKIKTELEVGK